MSYSKKTLFYRIPYMQDGDILDEVAEETIATLIENQLRLGSLSGPFIAKEGTYTTTVNPDNSVDVVVTGNPALVGCIGGGYINVPSTLTWSVSSAGFYYLYATADASTFITPSAVAAISSLTPVVRDDYLLLATLDNSTLGSPVLNVTPTTKPILANLNRILNSPVNPFGSELYQDQLTVGMWLDVDLANNETIHVKQLAAGSTTPVITIQNASSGPCIKSTNELTLADVRVSNVKLSDTDHAALPNNAISLFDALHNAVKTPNIDLATVGISGTITDDGSSIACNATAGNTFTFTLTGNRNLAVPSDGVDGQRILFRIKQDATGSRLLTLASGYRIPTSIASVTVSTLANATDYLEVVYNTAAAKWDVIRFEKGYA
jgi:hypothetical protein